MLSTDSGHTIRVGLGPVPAALVVVIPGTTVTLGLAGWAAAAVAFFGLDFLLLTGAGLSSGISSEGRAVNKLININMSA